MLYHSRSNAHSLIGRVLCCMACYISHNVQCGFSRLVVQILDMHGAKDYEFHDVLEDVDLKEGMKEYSNWPTFPQVYMNGELMGGADIMLEMHKSGELISELKRIGHF
jgi:monothiol glutaredoxin